MTRTLLVRTLLLLTALAPFSFAHADFEVGQRYRDALRSGGSGPQMVVIPTGSFVLGGGRAGEDLLGVVHIEYRLAISTTEITAGQYRQFLEASRSGRLDRFPKGDADLPAAAVSFDEAEAYVAWLSRETGHHYRLASASEWEYAARAGTHSSYSWGDKPGKNMANCLNCGSAFAGRLAPVASFPPNGWGVHDMHGNVWEWVKDCIDPNSAPPINGMPKLFGSCDMRELRGGSTQSDAWAIRASSRTFASRGTRNLDAGFRVVMDDPE